jgi:hypothetical protein
MAHNITFSRVMDDAAFEYIHTAGYEFRLPYLPDTGNTDLNGQTLEGGLFIWDGAATRLDYGLAFQWILNPWGTGVAEFGTIRCWTDITDDDGDRWQNVGYLEPDTSWHELRLVFDCRRQTTALTIDGNHYPCCHTATPKPAEWGTEIAARLQAEIVSLYVCEQGDGLLHKAEFRNWFWLWESYSPCMAYLPIVTRQVESVDEIDWFVDATNGNDANDGRSMGKAFQTFSAVEAVVSSGEVIGLARGEIWKEQLDITDTRVTVRDYGEGARPMIDASEEIATGAWSKTGGRTNVYECSKTPLWGRTDWLNVWEDDEFLTYVSDVATCDSTPGSYYPSGSSGTITIYVHTTNSDNPATNGSTYEYNHRTQCIYSDATGTTITNIHGKKCLSRGGNFQVIKTGATITGCLSEQSNVHGIQVHADSMVTNCVSRNMYAGSNQCDLFLCYTDAGETGTTTFSNCTASQDTYLGLSPSERGFFSHGFGTYDLEFIDCVVTNCASGIVTGSDATTATITNPTITSPLGGCAALYLRAGTCTVNGGTIDLQVGVNRAITIDNVACTTATISNLSAKIKTSSVNHCLWCTTATDITVTGSTFLGVSGSVQLRCFYLTNAGASLTVSSCVFGNNFLHYYFWTVGVTLDSDYNCFNTDGTYMKIAGTDYTTVGDYISGESQDAASTIGGCI